MRFLVIIFLVASVGQVCAGTIKCDNTQVGDIVTFDGINYTKVNRTMLEDYVNTTNTQALEQACTGEVTNMYRLFLNKGMNPNISSWDVSNVENFEGMFSGATTFNQNLLDWDTSKVTNMAKMFQGALLFNHDLSSWKTSKVTDMNGMFRGATLFNQDLSSWSVSSVENFDGMFSGATTFNQNLSKWDTFKVTNMADMFSGATSFNQDLSTWITSNVIDMHKMFYGATVFNQNLANWDTSKVTNMNEMFFAAQQFNGNISTWVTSNVERMDSMFERATSFNGNVSNWDTAKMTRMEYMFYMATSFNQSLTNWCVNSAFLNGLDNDGGQPYNATLYTRTNFSKFSPIDTIPAFHPLWNGIGCIYKCYNGGIRNVNDKITYSCICNEPDTGMYCNDITDDTTNTFTWWMILSISVGGALLLSGAVFTARKLFTTRTGGFALSNN